MSNKNVKIVCYLAIVVFCILQLLQIKTLQAVSIAVTVATLIDFFYDRYLWKFCPFEKTPKIYGVYEEESESTYNGGHKYSAKVTIKQTLSSVHILEEVEGSGYSESITAALVKNPSDSVWKLYYTYVTRPEKPKEDDMHEGTVVLYIESPNTLRGNYFTNRIYPTRGSTILRKK